MELTLDVQDNQLTLMFKNPSSQDVRLWELKNSWGWFGPRFELRDAAGASTFATIAHTDTMAWTRNTPSTVTVPAKGTYKMVISLTDGNWDVKGDLPAASQRAQMRVVYQIDPTPESAEFNVFTGMLESNWVQVEPPYAWLPAADKR